MCIRDRYIYNSKLQFYLYTPGPDIAFTPGVPVTVLFTRDAATGEMSGYVDGVWQWTITDSPNDATFTGPANIIYILIDDLAVHGESMSGSLYFFIISWLDMEILDLDLGDPVTTCDPYEIDPGWSGVDSVSYTHLRAHETPEHLVCRLLLEKKK